MGKKGGFYLLVWVGVLRYKLLAGRETAVNDGPRISTQYYEKSSKGSTASVRL